MTVPKDHLEPDILARKKSELFALCITVFIALNCVSYFVRDGASSFTQSHSGTCEVIGFPFLALEEDGAPIFRWYALFADLLIAFLVSWFIPKYHARKLPFLIRKQAIPFRYSIRSLLLLLLCMTVLMLVYLLVPQQPAWIRQCLFVLGPIVVGIIWSTFRHLSWSWLAVAGAGLFLLNVLATFPLTTLLAFPHSQLLPFYITKCIIEAFIAVGSILSGFALAVTFFCLLRHMDDLAEQARERTPESETANEQKKHF